MSEAKRGFLQSILPGLAGMGGGHGAGAGHGGGEHGGGGHAAEEFPKTGPIPVYNPVEFRKKLTSYNTGFGWYPHRIKYKGMLDLNYLYKAMALWFKEHRFELHERLFKSKPPEMEMNWVAERKRTAWVKEVIKVNVHIWGEFNIDAVVNGKKKKMAKVRMIVTVDGDVETPYADIFGKQRWNASNLERKLLYVFQKYVMVRELGGLYFDQLYYEMYGFYNFIKETLQFGAR